MRSTGAQIILQSLLSLNLKTIFAFNDKSLKWLFSEKSLAQDLSITFANKPENTIGMAAGFARTTGLPAVVIVPAGSGATQIIPGLVSAYLDSLPIICITGQVPSSVLGTDAFQEADMISMTQTCTKHNYLVKSSSDLQRILAEAYFLATTGRSGPIVINLPIDLLEQLAEVNLPMPTPKLKGYKPVEKGHFGQIKKALDCIWQSAKPIIYCGGGAILAQADKALIHFAESLHIPVAQTLTGISAFPGDHPLNLGLVGRGGLPASNMTANSADLVIAIGTRFNPHVLGKIDAFRVSSKIIHIDIDPSSIAKHTHVDVPIVGDAKDALEQILNLAKEQKNELKRFRDGLQSWHQQITTWENEFQNQHDKHSQTNNFIQVLARLTNNEAIITCGDESLSLGVAKNYPFAKPRHWCPTGGMDILGFALSAAIGAQKAHPTQTVIAITTLQHLLMNPAELQTVLKEKLPIRIVLLKTNNEKTTAKITIKAEDWIKAYGLGYSHCDGLKTFETQIKKNNTNKKAHVFDCENATAL